MHCCMHKFLTCKHKNISSFSQCVRFIFRIVKTLHIFSHLFTYLLI